MHRPRHRTPPAKYRPSERAVWWTVRWRDSTGVEWADVGWGNGTVWDGATSVALASVHDIACEAGDIVDGMLAGRCYAATGIARKFADAVARASNAWRAGFLSLSDSINVSMGAKYSCAWGS